MESVKNINGIRLKWKKPNSTHTACTDFQTAKKLAMGSKVPFWQFFISGKMALHAIQNFFG